jgi:hypothetical protein
VFVLAGRGLCEGPIPRPEESYRLWCVFECDQVKIKTLNTYCAQGGIRGKDYETNSVFRCQYHSTNDPYSSSFSCLLLSEDRPTKQGSLQSNALAEIGSIGMKSAFICLVSKW